MVLLSVALDIVDPHANAQLVPVYQPYYTRNQREVCKIHYRDMHIAITIVKHGYLKISQITKLSPMNLITQFIGRTVMMAMEVS